MGTEEGFPGVGLQLLDAQREAAVIGVDAEDDSLHHLSFFEDLGGMLDAFDPRHVGDVDQAVDAFFDFDEGAEIGEFAQAAFDDRADAVAVLDGGPGIGFQLFDAERYAFLARFYFENYDFDAIANLDDFGGVFEAARPGHLGNMDEAFDAGFEFDKGAVVGDADDASDDLVAAGVALDHRFPGVGMKLLEAERDALFVLFEFQHLDGDLIADVEHFGGVADAAVGKIADV